MPADYCAPASDLVVAPIDSYYKSTEEILRLGDRKTLAGSQILARLLLLGLVSGVESYFRGVLAGVLKICPLSRVAAAEQTLTLGGVDYYGPDEIALALFDRVSLAGGREIRSWTKKLMGVEIGDSSAVCIAVAEFDRVCHLRHAAVHAQGVLGSGNMRELGVNAAGRHVVELDFPALQNAGAVCHAVVRAYNAWLYEAILTRWNEANVLERLWTRDKERFMQLHGLMYSRLDGIAPGNAKAAYAALPFGVRLRR